MTTKTVNLKDFAKELGQFTEDRIEDLKLGAALGISQSIPDLVNRSPVDTGQYASSWDMTIEEKSIILGNYAPHAPIIEYGARPFTPPIQPLLAWAKRVLKDPSQPPEYSNDVWRLAKGVQKKIMKYGMEPKHILENELPNILNRIKNEWSKIV